MQGRRDAESLIYTKQVRCDDPKDKCTLKKKDPKCPDGTDPVPPGNVIGPAAYAEQSDGNSYSQINFCQAFFNQRGLDETIDSFKDQISKQLRLDLDLYDNRGTRFRQICMTIYLLICNR